MSQVNVFGTAKFAVHVQLDPNKLAARGIGIDEVENVHQQPQRQSAFGHAVGTAPGIHGGSQRPGDERGRLPAFGGHVPQRFAGAAGAIWAK